MTKKLSLLVPVLIFLVLSSSVALAVQNEPASVNSDPVFYSISITLTTYKAVDFSADTNDIVSYIKVASCWLQKKVDDTWVYVRSLPAPTYIEYNTIGYGAFEDYSSYIPSDGNTYRVAARFVADGHHATRYSNQRSF